MAGGVVGDISVSASSTDNAQLTGGSLTKAAMDLSSGGGGNLFGPNWGLIAVGVAAVAVVGLLAWKMFKKGGK